MRYTLSHAYGDQVPHGRYLRLPYRGYLRDIIVNLCATAPAARFCFIGGVGCMQDAGPDNLLEVQRARAP